MKREKKSVDRILIKQEIEKIPRKRWMVSRVSNKTLIKT